MKKNPPKWADKILEWYCQEDLLEDLQGDIHEFYYKTLKDKGPLKAKINFIIDVFKFCRPYTVAKPKLKKNMNQLIIFKNYLKTSVRNIGYNKLFSLINVVGLAISMSVGLLIITFLSELFSYDTFHKDADRIYRLNNTYEDNKWPLEEYASTSILAGNKVIESAPGVEYATLMRRFFNPDLNYEGKIIPARGLWASRDFFKVFSFKLLKGNPDLALRDLTSLVLTESTAYKLFGDEDPLGKSLLIDTVAFTVNGIVEDPPMNSHLRFEVLGSFATLDEKNKNSDRWMRWNNMWQNHLYFKAAVDFNPEAFQAYMDKISEEENAKSEVVVIKTLIQPLNGIMPGRDMNNQIGKNMDIKVLWILSLLAFIVIISACFNYNNLSIARSLRRSLEIGIRKVIGASKFQIFMQFIFEAVIIALLALVISIPLFILLKQQFMGFDPNLPNMVTLEITPVVIFYFFILAVTVGIIAGFFPAIFYAKINSVKALKDVTTIKLFRQVSIRKVLIVIQYTLSVGFIVGTTIAMKQYRYSLAYDLGFSTENILNLDLQGNDPSIVIPKLEQIPEVTRIATAQLVTSIGDTWSLKVKYNDPMDSVNIHHNVIDENHIPLLGHQIIAGRNFIRKSANENVTDDQVIVNEELIRFYEMGSPEEALDEVLEIEDEKYTIVGVVKDFHYQTLNSGIKPFLFLYDPQKANVLNLGIATQDLIGTMAKIDDAWKSIDKVHPLDATFYDDQIKKAYVSYQIMSKLSGFLAVLAITIASMGLLGMVVFTTESRLKEISIRKVLGADLPGLIYLMARGFLILLIISAIIALPVTYYLFDRVILADVAYKALPGIFELLASAFIVMMIALLAIGGETIRAAKANPADLLRSE